MTKRTPEELDKVIEETKRDVEMGKFKTVKEACKAHRLNISSYYTRSHKKKEPRLSLNVSTTKQADDLFLALKKDFERLKKMNPKQLQTLFVEMLMQ